MSNVAPSSLSIDIQRALQQAVGDANNAANLSKKEKKKKDKRAREEAPQDPAVKKRSKKHHSADVAVADAAQPVLPQSVPELAGLHPPLPLPAEAVATEQIAKPRKKKGKGKERAHEDAAPAEVPSPMDIATSSADFLSAVVAAASATSDHPLQPGHPQYDQPMPFLGYPQDFVPYPYPPSPHDAPFGHPQHSPMYPDPSALLPDLSFASSEELLRTLQDFDLSKVVTVLKTLGEAAAAANVSLNAPPLFMPPPAPQGPPPVQQHPVKSAAILGRPPKQKKTAPPNPPAEMTDGPSPSMGQENPEHAHMLANVWMNAQKLAEMVKSEGLIYKKGKFSAIEEAQLNAAIEHYRICKGLTEDQLTAIIFSKEKGRDSFWSEITSALHLRPIIAVYHHVRRTRHPLKQQGRWVPAEDDLLLQAVVELGQQWEKISERVGRMSSDCRDRYRNHLQNRDLRHSGHWTKGEEAELTQIVTEMTVEQGKDIDNDIFWGVVSDRMGGKRGRQQCRIKWTDSLSTQIKNSGERPRWNQMDAYILVHKIDSLNVRDDSEIDWKQLPDEHWNLWSAHALQRRWLTMKRGIKGYEDMSHFEIMEILKTKKAQSPPPPSASRKKKNKVVSAEAVVDSDDIEGISADATHLQAGPSTGLGTHAAATPA